MEVGGGVNLSPKQDNSLDEGRKTEVTQMVGVRDQRCLIKSMWALQR